MKLLIADDSSEKIGNILNLLREIDGFDPRDAEYVLDIKSARAKLFDVFYDLLILDLNMPEELGDVPSIEAGANFVEEIIDTKLIKKPADLIVLTAFDESAQIFKTKIELAGFFVLSYEPLSTEWTSILKSRVDYLMLCHEQRKIIPKVPKCDFAILTAVPIETSAVLALDIEWKQLTIPGDPSVYNYGIINLPFKKIHIIHAQQSEMGMTAAAAMTAKIITHFEPKYILMTGIAAGLDKDFQFGDIMVGTDIWNYSSGKYEEISENDTRKVVLSPDPKHIPMSQTLQSTLTSHEYDGLLDSIKKQYPQTLPVQNGPRVHFGPIACGVAVVASKEIVQQQVKAHGRKTIGLDMESYGVCYAAQTTISKETPVIIVKSISDLADTEKDDSAQPYAAYTSAKFAENLIRNILK